MKKIDLQSGKITYNEFYVDFEKPFSEQLEALVEDMVQIEYEDGYLIDIGWYPEYDSQGSFIVQVIKNYDWEKPVLKQQSDSEEQLKKTVLNSIEMIIKNLEYRSLGAEECATYNDTSGAIR